MNLNKVVKLISVKDRILLTLTILLTFTSCSGSTSDNHSGDIKSDIPKVIHQTWKTKNVSELDTNLLHNICSWQVNNIGYEYNLYNDSDCLEFVKKNHPDAVEVYQSLPRPVQKADFFRYLVLLTHGGYYSDIDTYCKKPCNEWVKDSSVNMIIGLELDVPDTKVREAFKLTRPIGFCQWTIASTPNHPILQRLKELVTERTAGKNTASRLDVIDTTGPGVFTDALVEYLAQYNLQPKDVVNGKVVGDVQFLPIAHFGSGQPHSNSPGIDHSDVCVIHEFMGSWLTEQEKK